MSDAATRQSSSVRKVVVASLIGTLLAFTTFAVGFIARPLGGVIFGHYGDKFCRKNVLIVTLLLMGISTFLIGVLPTYAVLGVGAPAPIISVALLNQFDTWLVVSVYAVAMLLVTIICVFVAPETSRSDLHADGVGKSSR